MIFSLHIDPVLDLSNLLLYFFLIEQVCGQLPTVFINLGYFHVYQLFLLVHTLSLLVKRFLSLLSSLFGFNHLLIVLCKWLELSYVFLYLLLLVRHSDKLLILLLNRLFDLEALLEQPCLPITKLLFLFSELCLSHSDLFNCLKVCLRKSWFLFKAVIIDLSWVVVELICIFVLCCKHMSNLLVDGIPNLFSKVIVLSLNRCYLLLHSR